MQDVPSAPGVCGQRPGSGPWVTRCGAFGNSVATKQPKTMHIVRTSQPRRKVLHHGAPPRVHRGSPTTVELQVRDARVTDVARITALLASAGERPDTGRQPDDVMDLLRQLVYLPNATVVVAVRGRELVGAAILSLRPSVMAGGLVGTVDVMAIDPGHESEGVDDALLAGVLRSARNKGCVTVDAEPARDRPMDPWTRTGFIEGRPRLILGPAPHRSPA